MPRVRFTVRRMMVLVAIAAVLFGVEAWIRARQRRLRNIAEFHRGAARTAEAKASKVFRLLENVDPRLSQQGRRDLEDRVAENLYPDPTSPEHRAVRLARFHRALVTKYDRAADDPWLPVAPDPPDPE
jgi:hypothetical protein